MPFAPRLFEAPEYEQGTALIAAAFYRDPLFLYWCQRRGSGYDRQSQAMAVVLNSLQKPGGGYSLGVFDDGCLLGLAYLKDSASLTAHEGVLPMLARVVRHCGLATLLRFLRVGAELPRHWPQQRHLYLSLLCVAPESQGRGFGRALLQAAEALARKHGYDTICLDTQNPDNVDYYRSFGYSVQARMQIGSLSSWCMTKLL